MRDPNRIDKMVEMLRRVWHTYPDLRLGQLISNLSSNGDPYYLEDDLMEDRLRAAAKGWGEVNKIDEQQKTARTLADRK